MADTGVQVTPETGTETSSTWSIFAPNSDAMAEAKETIDSILAEERAPELDFGAIYRCVIKEIKERGIMVEMHPELPLVFIPNSQLDAKKVSIILNYIATEITFGDQYGDKKHLFYMVTPYF